MNIGQRIHELIKQKKITQKTLSEAIGVSQAAISDWKKGSTPKSEYLEKIANFLNVSTNYLLTGEEDKNVISGTITNSAIVQGNHATTLIVRNGETHERKLSEEETELLRIFNILNIKNRTALLAFAYELEEKNSF